MAAFDQPIGVYSDTAAHKTKISDAIFMVDPMETPVVAHFGFDGANSKFKLVAGDNYVVYLLEDTMSALSTTANQGTTITTTTLSITVTDGSLFQPGDVILIDAEYMVVSAVSSNVITVDSRTYGGTRATHATGATITFVGMARVDGDDADFRGVPSLSKPYNYTGILQNGIKVTGSMDVLDQYGKPAGEYAYQMNKSIPELARKLERQFFHGIRRVGTASQARSMGGIGTFVTSNASTITTTLTKAAIEAVALAVFEDGGKPDVLIMGHNAANTLHGLLDTSSFVRMTQENTMFGMLPITRVNTQFFSDLRILVSRHCPADKAYMLDSSRVGFYEYRPWHEKALAITGDARSGEVVGEYSLLVANGALAHGYIDTSASQL